jgi:hypothetical protein
MQEFLKKEARYIAQRLGIGEDKAITKVPPGHPKYYLQINLQCAALLLPCPFDG